jgi:hypothetical protein
MKKSKIIRFLPLSVVIVFLLLSPVLSQEDEPEPFSITSARTGSSLDQVEVSFEANGFLIQASPAPSASGGEAGPVPVSPLNSEASVVESPMSLVAAFTYDERTLLPFDTSFQYARSLRDYTRAEAAINIEGTVLRPQLNENRRRIVVDVAEGRPTLFSATGPLTGEELDLIHINCNSLLLDRLLPVDMIQNESEWTPSPLAMNALFGLDAVAESNVTARVTSSSATEVIFELEGTLNGVVDGAETDIEMKARCQYARAVSRITWFALVMREQRSEGFTGPGLNIGAKIEVRITPSAAQTPLTAPEIVPESFEPTPELTNLLYNSQASSWRLAHARSWTVTQDEPHQAALRLMNHGELVSQCNIVPMQTTTMESMASLEEFQADLAEHLQSNQAQPIAAAQQENEAGYREYRVLLDGVAQELPIRWAYYLLTDQGGRQAMLAFVVEANLLDQFSDADRELVQGFRFTEERLVPTPE